MDDSYPTPWSGETADGLTSYDADALPQTDVHAAPALPGKLLPAILASIYFLSLWDPPFLPVPEFRWYMVFGLAIVAFLLQGAPLSMRAASPFWVVYGLSFVGAVASLLTATNFDLSIWNTVAFGVNFATFILLLPVLATRLTRRILLIALIGAALLWSVEIQRLVRTYFTLYYSSFGTTGSNKNHIGFGLAMAGTALFYLAVFWKPAFIQSNLLRWIVRMGLGLGGVFLFYNLSLIYTRSGLITAAIGISAVLMVLWIKSPRRGSGVLRVVVVALLIVLIILYLLPQVLTVSPQWETMADRVEEQGVGAFSSREELIRKGWYLVKQNPLLGVGIGGTRSAIYDYEVFRIGLIHNLYLTDWAEKGILGLLSYVVWFLLYLQYIRKHFLQSPMVDQIWLILMLLLFFEMFLKDLSSISGTMLAIFAGIYYEQYLLEHTQPEQPVSPYIGV